MSEFGYINLYAIYECPQGYSGTYPSCACADGYYGTALLSGSTWTGCPACGNGILCYSRHWWGLVVWKRILSLPIRITI